MIFERFKAAIEFLTIVSVGKSAQPLSREDIANSVIFFPIVGILLGGICVVAELLLRGLIPSALVLSIFPVIILAVLTRGLHLDGLADCFDALHFAGYDKEKALSVMKGKAIGAFGASALILVIVGKLAAISALPAESRVWCLLLIPALSRWTSAIVARQGAPASTEGLGYIFTVYCTPRAFWISGAIALLLSLLIFGVNGIAVFILVSALGWWLTSYFNRAFGGVTGDVFGAVIELAEVFGFLVVGIILT